MKEFVRRVTFTSSLIFLLVFSSFITLFLWQSRSLAQGTIPSNFQNSADKFNGTPTSAEEIREAIERKRTLSRVRRQTDLLQEEVEITSDVKAPSPDVASTIEKAFRIQYSDLILRQLGLLEHIEKPSEALSEKPSEALIEKPSAPLIEKPSPALIEKHLTQFGYDFFRPQELRRSTNIVLPGDYVLGPGDVLRVNMWGSGTDVELDGEVRPDGTITLPRLGIIPVAGIRYGDIKTIIAKEADKYIQGVNISVVIVRPRSLEIYVVGQVKNPGLRIIPAFSTVLNALIEAGGPLKVGSLRKIVISRKGKVFRRLDLYDLILKGDTKDDVLLEDKDVVYVPYIGPTVAVIGAVHRPAIFELKDKKSTLEKVLNYTGGPLAQAQVKLNLRRFERNQAFEVLDVALNDPKMKKIKVLDGDLVEVRYIGHKFPRAVKVTGHVWDMMEFTFREGMRLSEVISNKGIVKPGAITKYALLRRYDQATSEYSIEEIPLARIWEKEFDLPLRAYDEIIILSQEEFGIKTEVYLRGAV